MQLSSISLAITRLGQVWTPMQFFGSSEQGLWLDPSDFSTMFTDSAGTTPVTAVEQPVGLILDKSKGLVLGPELVTNGGFDSGTGWTLTQPTVGSTSISAGVANITSTDGSFASVAATTATWVIGKSYLVTFEVLSVSGAGVRIDAAGVNIATFTTTGVKRCVFTAANTTFPVTAVRAGATNTTFDNISVKELPGAHALQATSASRPVLSARVNLLTYSEDFSNAAWTKSNVTIVANAATAPDGTVTADRLYPTTSGLDRSAYQAVGGYKIMSVYAKAAGLSFLWFISTPSVVPCIWFNLSTGAVGTTISGYTGTMESVGDGWYRCTVVAASGTFTYNQIGVSSADNSRTATTSGTDGIYIWGAQVETGSTATRYQSITTATSYDTGGFPHYLKFDGVDDSLSTGTVDFTSTDKMTVFAGVRKLSDAARGMLCELGSSATGSFRVETPNTTGTGSYLFTSGGSLNGAGIAAITGYAAPTTNVITSIASISTDVAALRINGTQVATSAADQGTGNYGNHALYIGRRGSTTLPFNGHLYSLIVRAAQSTDAQIVSAESYVNSKTGGVY